MLTFTHLNEGNSMNDHDNKSSNKYKTNLTAITKCHLDQLIDDFATQH